MEIKDAVLKLIEITDKMQGINFKDVVEITSKHKLHPINHQKKHNRPFLTNLK